ncbi:hypothetical protein K488DRAFT_83745 [Vararia minispora EC-137]|uniref:Uncharacterized protein n=1 Tax=Vararia minispora EC-137 TaxID=1314806 RepID=A0ACB8QT11_9AGAM|nr:hypothetical protein K488DRAFT_83745 [Vararia minispora EC-137]
MARALLEGWWTRRLWTLLASSALFLPTTRAIQIFDALLGRRSRASDFNGNLPEPVSSTHAVFLRDGGPNKAGGSINKGSSGDGEGGNSRNSNSGSGSKGNEPSGQGNNGGKGSTFPPSSSSGASMLASSASTTSSLPSATAPSANNTTTNPSMVPCPLSIQLFCFDNNDPRITYSEGWSLETDPTSGRTLHASNITGSSLSLNFTGAGVIVFGFTGENGGRAVASYIVDGQDPFVPPVPSSSTPALLPLFAHFLTPDFMQQQQQQQQPQFASFELIVKVGNVSDQTVSSDFVLSHVIALPLPGPGSASGKPAGAADTKPNSQTPRRSPNDAAIVGGILGGIVSLLVGIIVWLVMRQRKRTGGRMMLWRRNFPARSFPPHFTSLTPSTFILAHRGVTETEPSEKRWERSDIRTRLTAPSVGKPNNFTGSHTSIYLPAGLSEYIDTTPG